MCSFCLHIHYLALDVYGNALDYSGQKGLVDDVVVFKMLDV
jgi:hypothetical protein